MGNVITPLPGQDFQQPATPGTLSGGASLAQPSVEQIIQQVQQEVRVVIDHVKGMARQYPASSEAADIAVQALGAMVEAIVVSLQPAPGSEQFAEPLP